MAAVLDPGALLDDDPAVRISSLASSRTPAGLIQIYHAFFVEYPFYLHLLPAPAL